MTLPERCQPARRELCEATSLPERAEDNCCEEYDRCRRNPKLDEPARDDEGADDVPERHDVRED